MSQKIVLLNVRLAFPVIWAPKPFANDPSSKPAYSASLLIADKDSQIDKVDELLEEVAFEIWDKKSAMIMKELRAKDRLALRSGDDKEQYDGFAGNHYISARSATKPLIIDRDKRPLEESDGRPYGGCYVNASVEFWVQDNKYGKRINATLRGLQFIADGDAFAGGAPATPEEFEDLGVDNSALA